MTWYSILVKGDKLKEKNPNIGIKVCTNVLWLCKLDASPWVACGGNHNPRQTFLGALGRAPYPIRPIRDGTKYEYNAKMVNEEKSPTTLMLFSVMWRSISSPATLGSQSTLGLSGNALTRQTGDRQTNRQADRQTKRERVRELLAGVIMTFLEIRNSQMPRKIGAGGFTASNINNFD